MKLRNGDTCRIHDWVLFKLDASSEAVPALGRICEIVILPGPVRTVVLLQHMDIGMHIEPYQMPAISFGSGNDWLVIDVPVSNMVPNCHSEDTLISHRISFVLQTPSTDVMTTNVLHQGRSRFTRNGR